MGVGLPAHGRLGEYATFEVGRSWCRLSGAGMRKRDFISLLCDAGIEYVVMSPACIFSS